MKHEIVFERTVVERVTVSLELPETATERDLEAWAKFGFSGMSPFDAEPDRFPQRQKDDLGWETVSAVPPLAKPEAPPPRRKETARATVMRLDPSATCKREGRLTIVRDRDGEIIGRHRSVAHAWKAAADTLNRRVAEAMGHFAMTLHGMHEHMGAPEGPVTLSEMQRHARKHNARQP